uniref:Uncharacterized protein n=1 Tax=Picea glauca TaxID=3330 RepID=A0A124GP05_PICGL|nr:hypothetical protein ABT39_MTgene296 [Picea glauca]
MILDGPIWFDQSCFQAKCCALYNNIYAYFPPESLASSTVPALLLVMDQ